MFWKYCFMYLAQYFFSGRRINIVSVSHSGQKQTSPLSLLSFPFQLYEITCHFHNMLWKYHFPLASADSGCSISYFSLFLTWHIFFFFWPPFTSHYGKLFIHSIYCLEGLPETIILFDSHNVQFGFLQFVQSVSCWRGGLNYISLLTLFSWCIIIFFHHFWPIDNIPSLELECFESGLHSRKHDLYPQAS